MTYLNDHQEDYINQGQQDDYFNEDLTTAAHAPQESRAVSFVKREDLSISKRDDFWDISYGKPIF
ncbi:hypothetical protein SD81_018415 [Tolypothrix campylonemoides VB511288]|nr:hypothetical protein SD81_018415 [Tolypothrix campylonemoides VB511288]